MEDRKEEDELKDECHEPTGPDLVEPAQGVAQGEAGRQSYDRVRRLQDEDHQPPHQGHPVCGQENPLQSAKVPGLRSAPGWVASEPGLRIESEEHKEDGYGVAEEEGHPQRTVEYGGVDQRDAENRPTLDHVDRGNAFAGLGLRCRHGSWLHIREERGMREV